MVSLYLPLLRGPNVKNLPSPFAFPHAAVRFFDFSPSLLRPATKMMGLLPLFSFFLVKAEENQKSWQLEEGGRRNVTFPPPSPLTHKNNHWQQHIDSSLS